MRQGFEQTLKDHEYARLLALVPGKCGIASNMSKFKHVLTEDMLVLVLV